MCSTGAAGQLRQCNRPALIFNQVVGMQFIPKRNHFVFGFANVGGVEPCAAELAVHAAAHARVQAQANFDAAVFFANWSEGCAIGQFNDAPGFQTFFNDDIQLREYGQNTAAGLVCGSNQFVNHLFGVHRGGRSQPGAKLLPHFDFLRHHTTPFPNRGIP